MKHELWVFYTHWIAPIFLVFMGYVAIRRILREWDQMNWHTKLVFGFNAVMMPAIGGFLLAYSITYAIRGR